MTDQQTQRYRPLAVGERIERGDEIFTCGSWGPAVACVGCLVTHGDAKFRRPIPETNWRDPVGEAGYPYPSGTVVELDDEDRDSEASQVFIGPACLYWFSDDKVVKRIFHQPYGMIESHRVIDYRPDLLDGETQTNLSRTDETQDLLPCPFCGSDAEMECYSNTCSYWVECTNSDCVCWIVDARYENQHQAANAWNRRRVTGLVNWLVSEMEKSGDASYLDKRYQGLRDCRKMVKRLLGQ